MKYELENAIWELTLLCNLRCIHCGSSAAYEREGELSTDKAIGLIRDLSELGCRVVQFMGGEPLLRRDWRLLAQAVIDHGMKLRIISNAFVLDKEDLDALERLQPEAVGISIDGASAETHDRIRGREGSFYRAMAAIDALMERGLPVTIITSLCKPNVFELDGIRDLVLGKGIGWQIQVVTPKGTRFAKELMISEDEFYFLGFKIAAFRSRYSPEELPVLGADDVGYHSCFFPDVTSAIGERGCQAGVTNIGIQSNGNIKGCLSLSDKYIEGNIRERSLKEIWRDPSTLRVNRDFDVSKLGGYCASCKHGPSCQGGCSDMAESLTGNPYDNPYCFYRIEQTKMEGGKQNVADGASATSQSAQ